MRRRLQVVAAIGAVSGMVIIGGASAQHADHYVLDAFGGVHAGGGAPVIVPATPYFGFDVAADIEYIPVANGTHTGGGILVLDKFGGVHKGGALTLVPPGGNTPYFGFDAARAIVFRDIPPRVDGSVTSADLTLSTVYQPLGSATIAAPDDGYVLLVASTSVFCEENTGSATGQFSLSTNGVDPDPDLRFYFASFPDCAITSTPMSQPVETVSISKLYSVGPGTHTFFLLGKKFIGVTDLVATGRSLTALYIDRNGVGQS